MLVHDQATRHSGSALSQLRSRWKYWWPALRAGLPHLWKLVGVVLVGVGGSLLAFVAFALGEPLASALILVLALLVHRL